MVNPFLCGSASFSHQFEKEDEDDISQCSTPRKSTSKKTRKGNLSRSKDEKNPYATRGLDKFSALLAEVEANKQKIYTQIPSDDISLVRFTYSDTDHIKPIVVRARDKKQESEIQSIEKEGNKDVIKSATSINEAKQGIKKSLKNSLSFKKMKIDIRKPSGYLPAMLILILVFLTLFGRSVAILSTCIGWYSVSIITERNLIREKKKKDYARRASDKKLTVKISSPKSVLASPLVDDMSPPRKGYYRKNW